MARRPPWTPTLHSGHKMLARSAAVGRLIAPAPSARQNRPTDLQRRRRRDPAARRERLMGAAPLQACSDCHTDGAMAHASRDGRPRASGMRRLRRSEAAFPISEVGSFPQRCPKERVPENARLPPLCVARSGFRSSERAAPSLPQFPRCSIGHTKHFWHVAKHGCCVDCMRNGPAQTRQYDIDRQLP